MGIVLFLILYIIAAMFMAPGEGIRFHFESESGIITDLSAISLAIASAGAGICFFIRCDVEDRQRFFWLLACLGFFFFAFDELFGFHERFDQKLVESSIGEAKSFRNWNDLVVIVYGLVALPVFFYFLPEILRLPRVAELLTAAFCFYVLHTLIDSTQVEGNVSIILEESCKLFASCFFALTMVVAALTMINNVKNGSSSAHQLSPEMQ